MAWTGTEKQSLSGSSAKTREEPDFIPAASSCFYSLFMTGYNSNRETGKARLIKAMKNPIADAYPSQGSTELRCPFASARVVQRQVLEIQITQLDHLGPGIGQNI